jgi:hypothetical protein
MPRLKDFSLWSNMQSGGFGFRDTAAALGYGVPSHARMKRLFDLFFPQRGSGEELKQGTYGLYRMALVDQLLDAGCSDEMALRVSRDVVDLVADDILKKNRPGFLVCLRGQHEILRTPEYVSAAKVDFILESWFDEEGNLPDGRTCCGIFQIDCHSLFTALANNLKVYLEGFESSGRYTVAELEEARKSLDGLRDLVDSAVPDSPKQK